MRFTTAKFEFARCFRYALFLPLLFATIMSAYAQDYPDEIRGYKVHRAKIIVRNVTDRDLSDEEKKDIEAYARVTEPRVANTSLSGLTFEISAEIDPLEHKGTIDFLMFRDIRVNGLAVTVAEYENPFEFKKKEPIKLPKPVSILLPTGQALRGAVGELRDSKPEWTVTGTVLVFGRFKKWGFKFKRVVPVEISLTIANPVRRRSILGDIIPSI